MPPRFPIRANPRVSPLLTSYASVSLGQPAQTTLTPNSPTVDDILVRPGADIFHNYATQLRPHLQWTSAAEMQLVAVRNAACCFFCAVIANACHYSGNIFSLDSSTNQSLSEYLMATLIWTILLHCVVMFIAHVPMLMHQNFPEFPDSPPTIWFCAKKLIKISSPYMLASIGCMVCVGLLVQNTSLMTKYFNYKLHFYLGNLCSILFTAGITFVTKKIYYEHTNQARNRRGALKNVSQTYSSEKEKSERDACKRRDPKSKDSKAADNVATRTAKTPKAREITFWEVFTSKLSDAAVVSIAGGYVHIVSSHIVHHRSSTDILAFAAAGVILKLAFQEIAKWYVLKKGIRSIRTMCVLVGLPTVLIDTQARIVLLGTQTRSFLVTGTFALALAEVFLRAGKAAYVMYKIHCRRKRLHLKLPELSSRSTKPPKNEKISPPNASSLISLRLEFELWRRQILAYHTAEITADTYAEYVAIGCSQSIIFWYVGHKNYPALNFTTANSSETDIARWRFDQLMMLGFQFVVEVFVDYVCVVMEMAAGIEFERIKGLSTFLCVLFMTMVVLNISVSATVYLE